MTFLRLITYGVKITCRFCNGTGQVGGQKCGGCDGKGAV